MPMAEDKFTAIVHIREKPSDPLMPGTGEIIKATRYHTAKLYRCPTCAAPTTRPMAPETAAKYMWVPERKET